ncbi:nitroreductase family deazaflavin-dependent oxidoreductase [Schumannella soli]|uniref:Nitroreductase family deazaflavin-dependent oxidoreductase n=1 Tax=Schumannella soli TaxID=2590779 RepID=A0A506XTK3_9MICO|nr:nitroreductase family deazaflavin-dependent oxidoreductase [Schumannella soli]TPW76154.1 nitroreductase family deazaflavin-dependent oxidoreductase [Schumannella soli]
MDARRGWLRFIGRRLNPLTLAAARRGSAPFTIVRHRGRRSGTIYETPIIVARRGPDFAAELTYGQSVQWYRNIRAAGGRCELARGDEGWQIESVESLPVAEGLAAYGPPRSWVLRLLRRHEFLLLRVEGSGGDASD